MTVLAGFRALVCALLILAASTPALAEVKRFQVPLEGSPVIGPSTAPITIIEFIDYQ